MKEQLHRRRYLYKVWLVTLLVIVLCLNAPVINVALGYEGFIQAAIEPAQMSQRETTVPTPS